ncbi:TetR family transcriptional regulator [Leucobacter sp. HY1910]
MVSTSAKKQVRKPAAERKREVVEHAAAIALDAGLERVTVRAVADSLGVRPGLIGHYFPAVESLVIAAFELAAQQERKRMFAVAVAETASVIDRLAAFSAYAVSEEAGPLARLWLNARNLCRFVPALEAAIASQESFYRSHMRALVAEGLEDGSFAGVDADEAAAQILIAFDGVGAYVNAAEEVAEPAYLTFVARVAELACGLAPGVLSRK